MDVESDGAAAATVRFWSLGEDAMVEEGPAPGSLTVVTRWGERTLPGAAELAAEPLRRMAFGPVMLRNSLPDGDEPHPGLDPGPRLARLLDGIGSAVVHSLGLPDGNGPLLSAEPVVADPRFVPEPVPATAHVRLSRFAALHPDGGGLLLSTPGVHFRVRLVQPLARWIVSGLAAPTTAVALAREVAAPVEVVADVVSFLVASGTVLVAGPDGRFAEDDDPALAGWTHHELLFLQHTRGRPPGATNPAAASITDPLPPGDAGQADGDRRDGTRWGRVRPRVRFALPGRAAPDPVEDPVPARAPVGAAPSLTIAEVGELLSRSARVREDGAGPERERRPYLSVARLYELELYLTVGSCAGLPSGIYHYDPRAHALTLVESDAAWVAALLDNGRVGTASPTPPPLLTTVTARTARLSWIVPGGALALALVHAGALVQTVHRVAETMGLDVHTVPAGASGGDDALGLRWPVEVGVAEFVVDRRRGDGHRGDGR